MKKGLRITIFIIIGLILVLVISFGWILYRYSFHGHGEYDIKYYVMPEDIEQIANESEQSATMICSYEYLCPYATEAFPEVYKFCNSLPMDFYVMFTCREYDSAYVDYGIKLVQRIDSTFNNFMILSDSLYDEQYRNIKQTGLFRFYGGEVEGNKYFNYIEKYIPQQFNFNPYPSVLQLILYKKNDGIVFVNEFDEEENTYLSSKDKRKIREIVYGDTINFVTN